MSPALGSLILLSVALSSGAQLLLKLGLSTPAIQTTLDDAGFPQAMIAIAASPAVLAGIFCFGLSVLTWLFVLSRVPVSTAYPFVALGIVTTVLGGRFIFGEPLSLLKLIGVAIILAGIMIVGVAGSREMQSTHSIPSGDA
jgi:multidrug transporter EmrE-like cation transporter